MAECKRCGKCCKNVWIPLSSAELQKRYAIWLTGTGDRNADIHLIYPMLKPTGKSVVVPIQNGEDTISVTKWSYKCVHLLLGKKGEPTTCMIHAHRPSMCRDYPLYGKEVISESITLFPGCPFNPHDSISKEEST